MGRFLFDTLGHRGDFAEFTLHAGGDDDPFAPAVDDGGAHPCHVALCGERARFGNRIGRFGDGCRLSGQHRFVDPEIARLQKTQIGGHTLAYLQHDDVAGDDLFGVDDPLFAVTDHFGFGVEHLPQGIDLFCRFVLLNKTEYTVEQNDDRDCDCIGDFADRRGDGSREEQYENQCIGKLPQQDQIPGCSGDLLQGVGTVEVVSLSGFRSA